MLKCVRAEAKLIAFLGMFQKRLIWLYSLAERVAQTDPGVYG